MTAYRTPGHSRIWACPHCHGRETRLSRQDGLQPVLALLSVRPYRCRECRARFWRPYWPGWLRAARRPAGFPAGSAT